MVRLAALSYRVAIRRRLFPQLFGFVLIVIPHFS